MLQTIPTIQTPLQTTEAVLKEYYLLKAHGEMLSQRLDSLKSILKDVGTCSSENYICLVDQRERTVGPDKKVLESLIGAEILAAHSRKIKYTTVAVKQKH
jgi:hypothetical protein